MITGFKGQNHPQQVKTRGALDEVDDRATSIDDFTGWQERFRFTLDAAAAPHNAKTPRYFTRADDGLAQSWAGERVWCNPPFSDCRAWVAKAWEEWAGRLHRPPQLVVMLLPANRAEQAWWQDLVEPHRDQPGSPLHVEFLRGRLRFDRPEGYPDPRGNRPPFGCCLLIWSRPEVTP
jgi:phage N-6-adenine-methyltransferase